MAYWIQDYGSASSSRKDFRMYHCDYRTDIDKLPLNDRDGVQQGNDTISCTPAHYGDQCFCLEDSSTWELRQEPNDWKEV